MGFILYVSERRDGVVVSVGLMVRIRLLGLVVLVAQVSEGLGRG